VVDLVAPTARASPNGKWIERPRASVAGTGGDRRVGCCSGMRGLRNRARRWRTDRDVPASECRRCAVVPPTVGGNRRARGVSLVEAAAMNP